MECSQRERRTSTQLYVTVNVVVFVRSVHRRVVDGDVPLVELFENDLVDVERRVESRERVGDDAGGGKIHCADELADEHLLSGRVRQHWA